jgi:hypothetical protein
LNLNSYKVLLATEVIKILLHKEIIIFWTTVTGYFSLTQLAYITSNTCLL